MDMDMEDSRGFVVIYISLRYGHSEVNYKEQSKDRRDGDENLH